MPTYLARDGLAFALGLTPRYGYCWPSAVEGRMAQRCDEWPRAIRWLEREVYEMCAIAVVAVVGYALAEPLLWASVAAVAAFTVRHVLRVELIRRRHRQPTWRSR